MKKNVGRVDTVIRTVIGFVAFYYSYTEAVSPWNYILYGVGIIMIVTAVRGSCPIFSLLGISTNKKK